MKRLQDGVLKGQILKAVQSGKTSSRAIFNTIEYDNHRTFLVEMNQLSRRGYLSKGGRGKCGKHPYVYSLTKKGVLHARDPFISIKNHQNFINRKVLKYMENTEKFQNAVAEYSRIHYAGSGGSGGGVAIVQPYDDGIPPNKPKTNEIRIGNLSWRLKRAETIRRRKELAYRYYEEQRYLDANFFKIWNYWNVYWIAGGKIVKPHFEILRVGDPEIKKKGGRGHGGRKATVKEMKQIKLNIKRIEARGVRIAGSRLRTVVLIW